MTNLTRCFLRMPSTVTFPSDMRKSSVIEDYLLHADFRRSGDTVLTIISPTGEKTEYDLHIEWDTFEIKKK